MRPKSHLASASLCVDECEGEPSQFDCSSLRFRKEDAKGAETQGKLKKENMFSATPKNWEDNICESMQLPTLVVNTEPKSAMECPFT